VLAALRAGARGYVLKGTGRDDLLRAIDNVCKGELILGSALASNFIRGLNPTSHAPASAFPELSAREAEILELIASGATNSEISASLFLSPNTVRNHITNIFAKLGVTHRAQAVVLAQRRQHDQRP
ncbi:MAG: response regulator transcription factor, partial [Mycobacterium sp.]|nr:response regulator transcription factor [Mycobacterium sp.]